MVIRLKKLLSVLLGVLLILLGLVFLLYGVVTIKSKEAPAPETDAQITKTQAPAEKPMVALTFDDGPYGPVTGRILDALQEVNGKATFFIVGSRISGREETVQKIEAAGCEIGNHTFDHVTLRGLKDAQVLDQLQKDDEALKKVVGHESTLLRPPGGAYNQTVLSALRSRGMSCVLWSVDPQDWKYRNTETVVRNVLSAAGDGDIVLLHDMYNSSVDAALSIIDTLQARGYCFVTVSELAQYKGVSLLPGVVYTRIS